MNTPRFSRVRLSNIFDTYSRIYGWEDSRFIVRAKVIWGDLRAFDNSGTPSRYVQSSTARPVNFDSLSVTRLLGYFGRHRWPPMTNSSKDVAPRLVRTDRAIVYGIECTEVTTISALIEAKAPALIRRHRRARRQRRGDSLALSQCAFQPSMTA